MNYSGFFSAAFASRMNSPELIAPCKPKQTPSRASLTEIPLVKKIGMAAITNKRRTFPRPDLSLYESVSHVEQVGVRYQNTFKTVSLVCDLPSVL